MKWSKSIASVEQNDHQNKSAGPSGLDVCLVHMVILDPEDVEVMQSAEIVYRELELRGIKALMDDRSVDTSEKFNEAERLALPVQVNIGAIGLHAGEVEVISRRVKEKRKVQLEDAVDLASELLRS